MSDEQIHADNLDVREDVEIGTFGPFVTSIGVGVAGMPTPPQDRRSGEERERSTNGDRSGASSVDLWKGDRHSNRSYSMDSLSTLGTYETDEEDITSGKLIIYLLKCL